MSNNDTAWEWQLESVDDCPVCKSNTRVPEHKNLRDIVFSTAPGEWNLYRCSDCRSAYLNPRPTRDSIGFAYQNYFTHIGSPAYADLTLVRRFRRKLANGYRNRVFGTTELPESWLGHPIMGFLAGTRAAIDAGMRHLPPPFGESRLLDLGCGNGTFLYRAKSAGWRVLGMDFDEIAVEAARRNGLTVEIGGIENLDPVHHRFEVITLSHVVEHLHDPASTLEACYNLLVPGGHLWLETPNIDSRGHQVFGRNWRGLEPPRHLVLFNCASLRETLKKAGFEHIGIMPYEPLCKTLFHSSSSIAETIQLGDKLSRFKLRSKIRAAEREAKVHMNTREFITLKAFKGSALENRIANPSAVEHS